MIKIIRTNSENQDFIQLVRFLDAYLRETDGEEHAFYAQFNKLDQIQCVVIAYQSEKVVGCGAIKPYSPQIMEVKRMYTTPEGRGGGVASMVLTELEKWAVELGSTKCILETGIKQVEAIGLYTKNQYQRIPCYGQYKNVENSVCFEKALKV